MDNSGEPKLKTASEDERALALTEAEKVKIRAEEIFRDEVRQNLEAEKSFVKNKDHRGWWWSTLNSSFVLWLLSSIVLAGMTTAFTAYENYHLKDQARTELKRKLDLELSNRIYQALGGLQTSEESINGGQTFEPRSVYAYTCFYMNNRFTSNDGTVFPEFFIFPEYRERSFRSLLTELYDTVDAAEQRELPDVLKAYEEMAGKGSRETKDLKRSAAETKDDVLRALSDAKQLISTRILKSRWKRDQFY